MQLTQADGFKLASTREKEIEDRKDKRTKLQATQQSQMISQRQNDLAPTDFESPQVDNNEALEDECIYNGSWINTITQLLYYIMSEEIKETPTGELEQGEFKIKKKPKKTCK